MLPTLIILYGITCFNTISYAFPLRVRNTEEAAVYLRKFGYIESYTRGSVLMSETFSASLKDFQGFVGLNETGELDSETLEVMSLPRCGVKDIFRHSETSRKKRYVLEGNKWRTIPVTYHISNYPDTVVDKIREPAVIHNETTKAFKVWSDVANIAFKETGEEDGLMDISFERRDHGDIEPFDGQGGVYAHAFPPEEGEIHFDDDEAWSFYRDESVNFFQVAAHEIGHSLGLRHTNVSNAVMFPIFKYNPGFKLHADDIEGIQALYGEPSDTTPNLCKDASFDTITRTKDGKSFVFKGRYYWRILSNGNLANGYPRKIADDWQSLEGNLDASFTHSNGTTFFFKGTYYWSFNNQKMDNGYPRRISKGFPGIPSFLDAALFWGKNSKIYFFKGTRYWRYDSDSFPRVRDVYPAQIAVWDKVLKNGIHAAALWKDNSSYFFKGDQYYKYDDENSKVENSYPVPTAPHWFGCGSNTIEESSE